MMLGRMFPTAFRCVATLPNLQLLLYSSGPLLEDLGLGSLDPAADYASLRRIPTLRYGGSQSYLLRSRDIYNLHYMSRLHLQLCLR